MLDEHDNFYYKIKTLVPDAVFSFWKDDKRHESWEDANNSFIVVDKWCISWNNQNKSPCPTLEDLNKVTNDQIKLYKDKEHEAHLNAKFGNDPIYKFCYKLYSEKNPKDSFCDFLKYINTL